MATKPTLVEIATSKVVAWLRGCVVALSRGIFSLYDYFI